MPAFGYWHPDRGSKPTILDIDEMEWLVEEARPTKYAFDLLLGRPAWVTGPHGKTTILTVELAAYLETRRYPAKGADLPLGRSTIKRLRSVLGLDWLADHAAWWDERITDLSDLTAADFAARHGVQEHVAATTRIKTFGRIRNRESGWWRKADIAEIILADVPRAYIAAHLGISIGAVGRLRWVLRQQTYGEI